jgi:uncharacterized protein (DUF2267 family)
MAVRIFDEAYDDTWRYERFVTTIQQKAGIAWDKAERAARATLETLAERISWGQANDLAADLPRDVRRWLLDAASKSRNAEPFGVEDFVRRVAAREDVDTDTAEKHARAVFVALARLVRGRELQDLLSELPREYERLLGPAADRSREPAAAEVLPIEEFLDRVEGRAGLNEAAAWRAIDAVLETLGERIAGGEVDDLAAHLAPELRPALERGKELSGGKAQPMSLDDFVARVSDREDVSWEDALEHARAVFATLREAIPSKELGDLIAELPRGYREALL